MQDSVIRQILLSSRGEESSHYGRNILALTALFELDTKLPEEIKRLRPSFLNYQQTMKWGGTPEQALSSALCALNAKHGCFEAAYDFIDQYFHRDIVSQRGIEKFIREGGIVPGFGSPVFKAGLKDDRMDEASEIVNKFFDKETVYELVDILSFIQKELYLHTKVDLCPNLVFWNAWIAHKVGLPRTHASLTFTLAITIAYLHETTHN